LAELRRVAFDQASLNTTKAPAEIMSFLEDNMVMMVMHRRDTSVAIAGELAGSRPH
jgi:hypothetical protein